VTETGQPQGNSIVITRYAPCGQPSEQSLPCFAAASPPSWRWITYRYDVLGRPVAVITPGAQDDSPAVEERRDYQPANVVTVTRAAGTNISYAQTLAARFYLGKSRVISSVIHSDCEATTTLRYDPLGRLVGSTDPKGISNTIVYDSLGRKLSCNNPDQNPPRLPPIEGLAVAYAYDPETGRLLSATDASGASVRFDYDLLGRTLTQSFSDGRVVALSYDSAVNGKGQPAQEKITAEGVFESLTQKKAYDSYGRLVEKTLTLSAGEYSCSGRYDPQGRLVQKTYPDGSVLEQVFTDGLLSARSLDGVQCAYSNFTAAGLPQQATQSHAGDRQPPGPELLVAGYRYGPLGLMLNETLTSAGATRLNFHYRYDPLNQLCSEVEGVGDAEELWSYRSQRLTGVAARSASAPWKTQSFCYDQAGDLLDRNGNSYTYAKSHFAHSITSNGDTIYTASQDACGRTRSRTLYGQTLTFDYDTRGCLRSVSEADAPLRRYRYDGRGKRIAEIGTDGSATVYIGRSYIESTDAAGRKTIQKFLFDNMGAVALIQTQGGERTAFFLRHDLKGSITHIFDRGGRLMTQIAYDGYGMPTVRGPDVCPLKYESKLWDGMIGLYYFNARYYDPFTGRFLTPDTRLGGVSFLDADVWNRFAFELNNPVLHVDPTGHWSLGSILGLVGGLVATLVAVALTVVTAGGAAPLIAGSAALTAAVIGAVVGAGTTAIYYSATHQNDFNAADFFKNVGVGALVGFVTGLATAGSASVILRLMEDVSPRLLVKLALVGSSTVINGSLSVPAQALSDWANDQDIGTDLGWAALTGLGVGVLSGLAGLAGSAFKAIRRGAVLQQIDDDHTGNLQVRWDDFNNNQSLAQYRRFEAEVDRDIDYIIWKAQVDKKFAVLTTILDQVIGIGQSYVMDHVD
jgi:RHS repeat-associated protein